MEIWIACVFCMFENVCNSKQNCKSSKDSELGQVKRIVKYSCGCLMLALTSNAFRKLKANNNNNNKKPKKVQTRNIKEKGPRKKGL